MSSNVVRIAFGTEEVLVTFPESDTPWPVDQARRWLDDQFNAHGCEPVRPIGKVLTIDKLVSVAEAIGQRGFEQDEKLRLDYAHAAVAALARPGLRVDVNARKVTY
jgi:hypothetical protein